MKQSKLTYNEAMTSPCAACKPSPCCSILHLDTLIVNNLSDLDKVDFFLNFHNIEVCLTAVGEWAVYYNHYCRFYDSRKSICTLHGTEKKPGVCVHYNPYHCFYRKADNTRQNFNRDMIWINRERMNFLKDKISFNENRDILEIPGKESVYEAMSRIAYTLPRRMEAPPEDKAIVQWKQAILIGTDTFAEGENGSMTKSYFDFQSPCRDCDAYCCRNLMFAQPRPSTYAALDFIRYMVGFPGLELGITDNQWYITAKTGCRHLEDGQCAVYESEERPLLCRFYDAMHCIHKRCFGKAKPEGFVRVRFEEFNWFLETFKFDEDGNITGGYDVNALRGHIESKWREAAGNSLQREPENNINVNREEAVKEVAA